MQTSGRQSFTGHEKYISRDGQNATKEKVENLFNYGISHTIPVSHSCKSQNLKKLLNN